MGHIFARGTAVFDYWLAHPEGLTVRPLNARVERAVGPAPFQPAVAVVVRAASGRTRRIPADAIVAVDPANEELFLAGSEGDDPVHEHVARVAGRALQLIATGVAWIASCVVEGAVLVVRAAAAATRWATPRARVAALTSARWLAPRAASGCRRVVGAGRSLAARRASRRDVSGDSPRTSL